MLAWQGTFEPWAVELPHSGRRRPAFRPWGEHPIAVRLKRWKAWNEAITNQPPYYHAAADQQN
jgi:hypothetical protein